MAHPLSLFTYCPRCGSSEFVENNDYSKRCEVCSFIYYMNPRAAVAVFVRNRKGELLVSRRAHDPAQGTLDLPGGFTDLYETAEQAVERELLEETGLIVKNPKYLFSLPNIYLYSGLEVHTMDLFFECVVADDIEPIAADDVSQLLWLALDKIDPNLFGLTSIRQAIEIYCK